ncbi:UDP-glucuronosyltransferase 2B14-like [Hyposmocoma kahamanoa]|uniref:UDP-glucuronosyltransferase 2B14-like n=1 Tax=Hyposmocoma kahamanoa TaxID=1477025 RepID=UPI000E6D775D|nr:UDP-glucuronosyltransferase 2B14-like [Hyposmocoma kahamanoa]
MFRLDTFTLCLALHTIVSNEAARILAIFPTPSISHQIVFRPITHELAKRGHNVTVLTTDPAFPHGEAPENLTEIDLHDLSYETWQQFLETNKGKKEDLLEQAIKLFDVLTEIFEKQMTTPEVKHILNQSEDAYDLLLIEAFVRPALSLTHKFKAPAIVISSFGPMIDTYEAVGASTHFFLFPSVGRQKLYNLTLWDKAMELFNHLVLVYVYEEHEKMENEAIRRIFGQDTPSVTALSNNIDMVFINIHPILEGNVPVPQSVVYIWGIHEKPQKELPKDLKRYLDSSKHGVIYMSFGTNTDPTQLPPEKMQMFVKAFSKMPYDVLWKWNGDELPGKSDNIKIGKWFPQSDLLRHPKVKLFITQGGIQSTGEAITAHVPMIGVPMLGDQWYNVEKYIVHGIGKKLDWETLSVKQIRDAIEGMIEDESYRRNIEKLDVLIRDSPQTPLERAVWWSEYVLRHGEAKHYRSPAANISWAEYLELELMLLILSIAFVALALVLLVLYYVYTYVSYYLLGNIKLKIH